MQRYRPPFSRRSAKAKTADQPHATFVGKVNIDASFLIHRNCWTYHPTSSEVGFVVYKVGMGVVIMYARYTYHNVTWQVDVPHLSWSLMMLPELMRNTPQNGIKPVFW